MTLSELHVTDENLTYQQNGPFYYGREGLVKSKIMAYSIKDREWPRPCSRMSQSGRSRLMAYVLAQSSSKEIKLLRGR